MDSIFLLIFQFVVATALFGIAAAAYAPYPEQSNRPQAAYERNARILALDSDLKEDSYRYNYETENGIKAEETGREVCQIQLCKEGI